MDQEQQKSQRCEMKIEEICDVSKAKRLLTKSKLVGGFATLFGCHLGFVFHFPDYRVNDDIFQLFLKITIIFFMINVFFKS